MQCITSQWHRSSAASVKDGGYCGECISRKRKWRGGHTSEGTLVRLQVEAAREALSMSREGAAAETHPGLNLLRALLCPSPQCQLVRGKVQDWSWVDGDLNTKHRSLPVTWEGRYGERKLGSFLCSVGTEIQHQRATVLPHQCHWAMTCNFIKSHQELNLNTGISQRCCGSWYTCAWFSTVLLWQRTIIWICRPTSLPLIHPVVLYHNKNKCWQASYLLTFMHVLSDSTVKCVQDLATERLLTCSQSPQSITWTACQANGFTHLVSTDPFATCIIHVYRGEIPQV